MYIKTVLIAAAVFSTVAAYDFADWLASMYAGDHNIVNIGTTGKNDTHTTYRVDRCPPTTTNYHQCAAGDGVTIIRGQHVVDTNEVKSGQTISQRCTYSGISSAVCTVTVREDGKSTAFTTTMGPSDLGPGPYPPAKTVPLTSSVPSVTPHSVTATTTPGSTTERVTSRTATREATGSESTSGKSVSPFSTGRPTAQGSATQSIENTGMQVTGKACAVLGAAMMLGLAAI